MLTRPITLRETLRKNNKMKNTEQMFWELRDCQGVVGAQDWTKQEQPKWSAATLGM